MGDGCLCALQICSRRSRPMVDIYIHESDKECAVPCALLTMSSHDVNWLRLQRIEPVDVHLRREVSSPSPGVAIIDIVTEPEIGRSPNSVHWRIGDWRKPPIDISIRP